MVTRFKKAVLEGQLVGITWGCVPCKKEVFLKFPDRPGSFIPALMKLCNDGDFANCKLSADTVIEVTFSTTLGKKSFTSTKTFTITDFPSAKNFVAFNAFGS